LVIADVSGARVTKVHFAKEVPVSFAIDWKKSTDGTLSDEIRAEGIAVLRRFVGVCEEHSVAADARCAVATEVFRKAANGPSFLEEVRHQVGLAVEVVTQDVEADLGFRTAVALQDGPAQGVICWDSGGASFQITTPCAETGDLRKYVGALGSGVVAALLMGEVLGRDFATAPTANPVKASEAASLVQRLKQECPPAADWLRGSHVTAIGGPNSMFCVACEVLGVSSYALAELRRALSLVVGLTDDELLKMRCCQGDLREPPSLIVSKICLLLAVVEHCSIDQVTFCPAIGSCQGLLISEERYAAAK